MWPQTGIDLEELENWDFRHFFIQPMDCADGEAALAQSIGLVMARPHWRLTLQTHKLLGLR